MKRLCILLVALTGLQLSHAQYVFTLDHAGSTKVYSTLDSALLNAVDGDYLYLPGIAINGNVVINKRLQIFGAGHYPDSTQATGQSIINGTAYLQTGATGSILQGIYIQGSIILGNAADQAAGKNIVISRCNMSNIYLSENGSSPRGAENIFIRENVVRDAIYFAGVRNVIVENNLIEGGLIYGNGMINLRNNIFLRRTSYVINNFSGGTFENNIFLSSDAFATNNGNYYYNNIFKGTDPLGNEFSSSNLFNVSDLFINQSGVSFSYQHNYHLTASSPARGAGTQGTDCGIYGGSSPYKEGAVPANPHIQFKSIPTQTDAQGKINIQVRVAAQQN